MSEIRPLQEVDLPAVERLLADRVPGWSGDVGFLASSMLAHPWADPELASLVALDDAGTVVGFIGAQARRVSFDDRALRGVCCSSLAVVADPRAGAAGALLLRRLLSGPQDLTWSDSANETVARMWQAFGGQLDHARALDWMLVLRPVGWIGSGVRAALHRQGLVPDLIPVGAFPLHGVPGRGARRNVVRLGGEIRGDDASAEDILEHQATITARLRFRIDHDVEHLDHLLAQIRLASESLVCRLVRRGDRPIGWYAYRSSGADIARVLHLAASGDQVDDVVGELVNHAAERGSRVLAGRLEPHLDAALRSRSAIMGFAREPVLHAKDPELRAVLSTGSALLTQLDSEWFVT